MFERDFVQFCQLLDDVCELKPTWKPWTARAKALFFKAMEPYPLEVVSQALTAHIRDPQRGVYQPAPADLVAQIDGMAGNDSRPGADEAWAIALTSCDEADTVVWTTEIAEAFAICQPVLKIGDEVGARVAFKDAYNRIINKARNDRVAVKWVASLGWDLNRREAALTKASGRGLLAAPEVAALLPPPRGPESDDAKAHEQIRKIKEMMAAMQAEREREFELHQQRERDATAEAKRRLNEMTENYRRRDEA